VSGTIEDLTISHFIGDGNREERKAAELVAASKMGLIVIPGRDARIWKGNAASAASRIGDPLCQMQALGTSSALPTACHSELGPSLRFSI
jgi:hypothetical protein